MDQNISNPEYIKLELGFIENCKKAMKTVVSDMAIDHDRLHLYPQ